MGREFVDLFNDWAHSYDQTVSGRDPEYVEVFEQYNLILDKVIQHTEGPVLEFGVGTGNLTKKLLQAGHTVYGVEPSKVMREKTIEKLPDLKLFDGDFLHFPAIHDTIKTIVSTYAFHHLTDEEKDEAIGKYYSLLPKGGKIILADTMYESELSKKEILSRVREQGYTNLLHDLETEYYPMKSTMESIYRNHGFEVTFEQLNRYVWLTIAMKKE